MRFITAAYSDVGSRECNEDSLLLEVVKTSKGRTGVFLVSDGIGSLPEGEIASGYIAESMRNIFFRDMIPMYEKGRSLNKIKRLVNRSFLELSEELRSYGERKDEKLGAAVSVLFILGHKYIFFHLGDTRIYKYEKAGRTLITKDHREKDGRLNKCLGSFGNMEAFEGEGRIKRNTGFLVASDGFYSVMEKDAEVLKPLDIATEEQLEIRLLNLGLLIKRNHQEDNASAIYVKCF